MILRLFIQNLILIEKAEVRFSEGLHVITGETGAGKSVLLQAIRLLMGAKADVQQIRSGASSAIIEADLILPKAPLWLEEEGIEVSSSGALSIRREIHASGKNRCFLEEQLISLSMLKKIMAQTIELVDQNSSGALISPEMQRKWLDDFADLSGIASDFAESFAKEKALEANLEKLFLEQKLGDQERRKTEEELEILNEANVKEGEEKELIEEHKTLAHAQELQETASQVFSLLSESAEPIALLLKKAVQSLEHAARFDQKLLEPAKTLKQGALEVEEAAIFLRSYIDGERADPQRFAIIEERLAILEKIKRRFGNLADLVKLQKTLSERLDNLSNLDEKIFACQKDLDEIKTHNFDQAEKLSTLRKEAALCFASTITKELQSLNLPHAHFEISLCRKSISIHGIDEITFLFSANPGYLPLPLEDSASGGERSRIFLAIKTRLAEKDESSCLIFDEIDSNVGGKTAAILGEKLQTLAKTRQVICVTHFVQVAKCAAHHFLVSKENALTRVEKLIPELLEEEFSRMLGEAARNPSLPKEPGQINI